MLELISVTKKYGQFTALSEVCIVFTPGIYGVLGSNGAGKSTMMNLISTLSKPSSGELKYQEQDIFGLKEKYRGLLGYMPQHQALYPNMSIYRFLLYIGALKGISKKTINTRIDLLLEELNLSSYKHRKIKTLSGGMKQRLLIAQAILNDPKIVILDEPTAGLDPVERMRLRNFIKRISKDKIILLATHVVSDIEYIADRVILLKQGHILANQTQEELISQTFVIERLVNSNELDNIMEKNKVTRLLSQGEQTLVRYILDVVSQQDQFIEYQVRATLDDVYLKWLG